ncbi:MAG: TIGR03986 family CRISPR-associated RAMP protein [Gorillibacterium sp.]|nr:TIGR03986 family CRISPR-associated RAMP protein [Gorillibacterium sp.]
MADHKISNKKGWTADETDRFINPYNFVPFGNKCDRSAIPDKPGNLTGYLECGLDVLTPLFIPNTSNNKALHHTNESQDESSNNFFSYADLGDKGNKPDGYYEPVIPGSEIRGVVRSVFEAAFNGCMSSVEGKRVLKRRTTVPKKPGLLKKHDGKWVIIPCDRWMINRLEDKVGSYGRDEGFGQFVPDELYASWEEGKILYVDGTKKFITSGGFRTNFYVAAECSPLPQKGWISGYLHKGEPFVSKHHESVFVPKKEADKISVRQLDVDRLEQVLEQYADKTINKHIGKGHNSYKGYDATNVNGILVYYSERSSKENKQPLYMTPACLSKEIFDQQIEQLLKQNGEYQPCTHGVRDVCPSCALFGMVTKDGKGESRASRVRFEDGHIVSPLVTMKDYYLEDDITLPEMGEPKPGTVEFYTLSPKEKEGLSYEYWTYDYLGKGGNDKKMLSSTMLQLRGRKFYWHSDAWRNYWKNKDTLTTMRQRIRPLKPSSDENLAEGPLFKFRIYFENVTELELMRLQWALTFNDDACAHKIGRAKPLGFGSARITILRLLGRSVDPEGGEWKCEPLDLQGDTLKFGKEVEILKQLADWKNKPKNVSYHKGHNSTLKGHSLEETKNASASHQWFNGNRDKGKFSKVLPKPDEERNEQYKDKWLYKLKK